MNKEKYQFGKNNPIQSSLTQYYNNCMIDSKENYKFDLGVKE